MRNILALFLGHLHNANHMLYALLFEEENIPEFHLDVAVLQCSVPSVSLKTWSSKDCCLSLRTNGTIEFCMAKFYLV